MEFIAKCSAPTDIRETLCYQIQLIVIQIKHNFIQKYAPLETQPANLGIFLRNGNPV
jgi:hypothetical protein